MELKEFIKSTISELSNAVIELNQEFGDQDLIVNPTGDIGKQDSPYLLTRSYPKTVTEVNFDLSVSVSEVNEKGGKIGILSNVVGAGVSSKNENENSLISRIQFKILVLLPSKDANNL